MNGGATQVGHERASVNGGATQAGSADRQEPRPPSSGRRRALGIAALVGGAACLVGWWAYAIDHGALSLYRDAGDQLVLPSYDAAVLWAEVLFAVPGHGLLLVGLVALLPSGIRLPRWSPLAFAGLLYLGAAVAIAALRYAVQIDTPITDDDWAYIFQARTLAAGRLWAPPPPDAQLFDYLFLIVERERWFCIFQPGLAVLMVPGLWLSGDPFVGLLLVNAGLPVITYGLGRRLANETVGRAAALLLVVSPWYLLTAAQIEPYAPMAFAVLLWTWLIVQVAQADRVRGGWAVGLGALMGGVLLLRGFEFGVLGLALAGVQLFRLYRGIGTPRIAAESALILVGLAPFAATQLAYNAALTGSPWSVPLGLPYDTAFWGFGEGVYNQHDLGKGLALWGGNWLKAACWLAGTPLALVAVVLTWRDRLRHDLAVVVFALFYAAMWVPYSMAGVADFGPVYLFAIAPLGLIVAARSLTTRPTWLGPALLTTAVVSLLTFVPLYATRASRIAQNVAAPYAQVERAAADADTPLLVLVRRAFPAPTGWVFGLKPPDPFLTDAVVFVWAPKGPLEASVRAAAADRSVRVLTLLYEQGQK